MYIFVSLRGEIMRICKSNCKNNPTSDCMCVFYIKLFNRLWKKLYSIFYFIVYTFLLFFYRKIDM